MIEIEATNTPKAKNTTDIKRIREVNDIVEKHLDAMTGEIWNTLKESEKMPFLGHALVEMSHRVTDQIMNELIAINACD